MLEKRGPELWTYEEPLRLYGIELGRITTVIRLSDGGLFVQSPAELTDDLRAALADLGDVRFVAPASKLHGHRYMEQYREAFPDVELLAAPGLPGRREDLSFDRELDDDPEPEWEDELDQTLVEGHRWITEVAFFHWPSGTVILGDVGFNLGEDSPLGTRLVARALGVYGRLGTPREFRYTVDDEAELRESIETVLAWDFDRVVPGHGEIVETGGERALEEGFDWVL